MALQEPFYHCPSQRPTRFGRFESVLTIDYQKVGWKIELQLATGNLITVAVALEAPRFDPHLQISDQPSGRPGAALKLSEQNPISLANTKLLRSNLTGFAVKIRRDSRRTKEKMKHFSGIQQNPSLDCPNNDVLLANWEMLQSRLRFGIQTLDARSENARFP